MTNTYFTSDTHWGHQNIIKYSNRPFKSVEEMDEAMIKNWNERVSQDDDIYHLGDVAMGRTPVPALLARLNGRKHLIWGNHDSEQTRKLPAWNSSQPYLEINLEGNKVILCHYAMRVWNKSHHGSLMLYGHSHGSLPGTDQSCDVGVDCFDYKPATLTEIIRHMKKFPPYRNVDHHGRKE